MKTFEANGTNDLMRPVYRHLSQNGLACDSRNGPVIRCVGPVALVHKKPNQHINFCPIRNANPVFHLMEALAILAGYNNVAWLSQFNSNMKNFSDDGETFNAFYGTRIGDQLANVIDVLAKDTYTRQAVVNIWNPEDLTKDTKDKACNLSIVFSVDPISGTRLDMIVYNRSNDAIWGTVSGANEVQFPFIMMYVAESLGLNLGEYTHVTNNLHVYQTPQWAVLESFYTYAHCETFVYKDSWEYRLFADDASGKMGFDADLKRFITLTSNIYGPVKLVTTSFNTVFFKEVVYPIYTAYMRYKAKTGHIDFYILPSGAHAWNVATRNWIQRAIAKREGGAE